MKKVLEKTAVLELFHYANNKREEGPNPAMSGDCSWLRGDCSGLRGVCTGLRGDCSGLRGDCSELRGDIDKAELTAEEREKSVAITDLIKERSGVRR